VQQRHRYRFGLCACHWCTLFLIIVMIDSMCFGLQASAKGLGLFPPSPALMNQAIRTKQSGQPWPPPPQGWAAEFHRTVMRLDAELACVSVVLCDDKPNSFGAPDVLQVGFITFPYASECSASY
jgi:hypothetical protein